MADPISMTAGLVALVSSAQQSVVALYDTVRSFAVHPQRVRELTGELESLGRELRLLGDTSSATADEDLSALKLPLVRCGNACEEFEEELVRCWLQSGCDRTSFRDWSTLKYMGDDLDGFRHLLARYKSTIIIALTKTKLETSATADILLYHKAILQVTINDLETHLQRVDDNLMDMLARTATDTYPDTTDLRRTQEEQLSIKICLQICTQLSEHIDQLRSKTTDRSPSRPMPIRTKTLPERITFESLQECRHKLNIATAQLEKMMQERADRLAVKLNMTIGSEEERVELARLQEEWETGRLCIDICLNADDHLKHNISSLEDYSQSDDAIPVSTTTNTIRGRTSTLGRRSSQTVSQHDDGLLRQELRDTSLNDQDTHSDGIFQQDDTSPDKLHGIVPHPRFNELYGQGHRRGVESAPIVALLNQALSADDRHDQSRVLETGFTDKKTTMANAATGGHSPLPDSMIIKAKGEFIAGGTTSLVELLPSGDIVKTPWSGDDRAADCRKEIEIEARIYRKLGEHPRLVKLRYWDAKSHTLTLEYMPNGTLEEYLKGHSKEISLAQKLTWVSQAAEALDLLHSTGIVHCDVGPHNFLLDTDLSLKIADFSGSSVDGSCAMVCSGPRYAVPDPNWEPGKSPTFDEDLFALGSTIYFVFSGRTPFEELENDAVEQMYIKGSFPDLEGIPCGDIISLCWHQAAGSAQAIRQAIDNIRVA